MFVESTLIVESLFKLYSDNCISLRIFACAVTMMQGCLRNLRKEHKDDIRYNRDFAHINSRVVTRCEL